MKTQICLASLLLPTILCLALTASAQVIFSEGPIDGFDNALCVTGPNTACGVNPVNVKEDVSNGFVAQHGGSVNFLEWGEWVAQGGLPTGFSASLGTGPFLNDVGGFDILQQTTGPFRNSTFLFGNAFGFDVYDVLVPFFGNPHVQQGQTYWLTISNATDPMDSAAWDIPNNGLGGPATCNFRQGGANLGNCGLGGESFTLSSTPVTTPEPSAIMLLGSGILGIAGVLRRRLMG